LDAATADRVVTYAKEVAAMLPAKTAQKVAATAS
jgi:hypothetical protein